MNYNIQTKFQVSFESWKLANEIVVREHLKLMNDTEKLFIEHIVMFSYPIHINKVLLESGLGTSDASHLLDFCERVGILNVDKNVTPGQIYKGTYFDLIEECINI